MERPPSGGNPPPKSESTPITARIRNAVDKMNPRLRTIAALAATAIEKTSNPIAHSEIADAAELQREAMVAEHRTSETRKAFDANREGAGLDPEAARRRAALEKQVATLLAEHPKDAIIDLKGGFSELSLAAAERIAKSDAERAWLKSNTEQFPNADQLGIFAGGKPTVYLNSTAFDRHLPTYGWLSVTRKIRPDREWKDRS